MFEYSIMKVIACVTIRSLIVKRRIVTAGLRQYAMFQLGDQKSKYQEQLDWWYSGEKTEKPYNGTWNP